MWKLYRGGKLSGDCVRRVKCHRADTTTINPFLIDHTSKILHQYYSPKKGKSQGPHKLFLPQIQDLIDTNLLHKLRHV